MTKAQKRLMRNTCLYYAEGILSRLMSFILIVVIARYLGDVGLGKYSYAFAFAGLIVALVADFGISSLMIREVAKDRRRADKYFNNIISLKLALIALGISATVILNLFIDPSIEIVLITLFAAMATSFDILFDVTKAMFQTFEKMSYYATTMVLERIIALAIGVTLLVMGYGIIPFMITFIVSNGLAFFTSLFFVKSKLSVRVRPRFDLALWKSIMKRSLPFFFSGLFIMIYIRIDTVMLTVMTNYQAVGWYNAAYKVERALILIPGVIYAVLYPLLSKYHKQKELLAHIFQKSFQYLLMSALPLAIGLTLLADRVILFVYKQQFIHSILALQILVWADVFIFVNFLMGFLLNSIDKQNKFSLVTGIGAGANIVLNLILIPLFLFGYPGAALATVMTEMLVFVLLMYYTSKYAFSPDLSFIWKPVIAGAIMAAVVISVSHLHLFLIIPMGAVVYGAVLLLLKGIGKEELDLVKKVI